MGLHPHERAAGGLSRRLERLGVHDHACLIPDSEDQRLQIDASFLQIGLERGERCVYVADENTAGRIMPYLRAAGTQAGRALASGSLVITTDGSGGLRSGSLDPGEVLVTLESQIDAALRDGHGALRIAGEARVLGRATSLERLVDYEERLKALFRDRPVVALWRYDRLKCSPGLLRHSLGMHPFVIIRGEVYPSCLFVPPSRQAAGRQRQDELQRALDAIVARARADEARGGRIERLNLALEGGAHVLWEWDLESDRVALDPQWAEMPGIEPSRPTVTLSEWEQVLHPDDLGPFWKSATHHFEGRSRRLDHECRMRDRSGSWRRVHLRASAIRRDQGGRPTAIAGTATDVTELHAARERLYASDQLATAGTIAERVAREIGAPLARITTDLGFARNVLERLRSGGPAAAGEASRLLEVLEEAQQGASRIRDVVDALPKAFGSSEDGKKVPCDVREAILTAVSTARDEIAQRARVDASLPERLPRVLAHERTLGRIFVSLLVNAARAIPSGAPQENEVRIAARAQGEQVAVEVTDSAAGMSAQDRARTLDLFFTTSSSRSSGVGVGLLLCRALIERSGGRIEVESDPERGTTVRVLFPVSTWPTVEKPVDPDGARAIVSRMAQ